MRTGGAEQAPLISYWERRHKARLWQGESLRYFKKIIPTKTTAVMTNGIHIGQPAIAEPTKSKAKTTPATLSNMVITPL